MNLLRLLGVVALLCVILLCVALFGKGKRLGIMLLICLGSMLLLLGGQALLAVFRLAWRNGAAMSLALTALFSGVGCIVLALRWVMGREMPALGVLARRGVKALAVVSALVAIYWLLIFGLVWSVFRYGYGERVLEYQGKKLVEEKLVWLDVSYRYFEYHNPLIRGMEDIEFEQEPLEGD